MSFFKKKFVIIIIITVLLGGITGFFLSLMKENGVNSPIVINTGSIDSEKVSEVINKLNNLTK